MGLVRSRISIFFCFCVFVSFDKRWEGRDAFDWFYEADIRRELGDDVYFNKVESLAWMARFMDEWQEGSMPHSDNPWTGFSLLQRYRIYKSFERVTESQIGDNQIFSSVTEMLQREPLEYEPMVWDGEALVVPAMSRTTDNGDSVEHSVEWMSSFEGGMQLHLHDAGEVEYDIPANMIPERKTYVVKLLVAAVHEDDPEPYKLVITSTATGESVEYEISSKYTYGLWDWTDPIDVQLGGGDENIRLFRDSPAESVSIKQFIFTPL